MQQISSALSHLILTDFNPGYNVHEVSIVSKKAENGFDHTEKFIELGYNIAYYRKHAGLTQEQLAELVGISRQHMGAIEAPNICRPISLELLFSIAEVLEIRPEQLLQFRNQS